LLIVICALVAWGPKRTVTPIYFNGARHWMAGSPLYDNTGTGFIYLPQAAVIFLPLAMLPVLAADLLWRCFTIGTYAWGIRRLSSLAERSSSIPLFGLATLVAAPLPASSAKNGQATLPMAGMMMLAVTCMADRSWWRAAGCLTLAVSVKPLAVVLLLLSVAMYRPMIGRLLVAVAVAIAIPFLTQNPAYVQAQYQGFVRTVGLANEHSNVVYFAQLFGMLRVMGLEVNNHVQSGLRGVFGGLTLFVCLAFGRRMDGSRWAVYFYALSACYVMLFNPRTENNTYSMLAPAIAVLFAQSVAQRRVLRSALLLAIAAGTLGTYEIGRLLTVPEQSVWLAPLACLCFTACVLHDLVGRHAERWQAVPGMFPTSGHAQMTL